MRIIAGEFRRRPLHSPRGMTTRPMPDRVKESLFSMLGARVEGARVLDAFAGSGQIGLEAISRGAASCVFVEKDRGALEAIERNVEMLGCGDRCEIFRGDALGPGALARCPERADLVFFDPPYPLVAEASGWRRVVSALERIVPRLAPDGFLMLRTPWPFFLMGQPSEELAPGAPPAREPRPSGRKRPPGRWSLRDWEREDQRVVERGVPPDAFRGGRWFTPEQLEDIDPGEHDAASETERTPDAADPDPGASSAAPAPGSFADLSIPGAKGPETHRYRHSAVHFYMRSTPG
ncbi:MAG: RsmD family RNA methyltransferase [Phycisphaerae bacterium]|nr:RsmD family RNA methyltransferase [Phycisphaerae bacterium]